MNSFSGLYSRSHQSSFQSCRGGIGNHDFHKVSRLSLSFRENDHLVLGSASEMLFGITFGFSLYEDFKNLSYIFPIVLERNPVLEIYHPVESLYLYIFRHIIRKVLGCECAGSFRIFKKER